MNEEILQLRALCLVQMADMSVLLSIVQQVAELVRPLAPKMPEIAVLFATQRATLLQALLIMEEDKDKVRAAYLQQAIDQSSTHYPFDV